VPRQREGVERPTRRKPDDRQGRAATAATVTAKEGVRVQRAAQASAPGRSPIRASE